jgi:hypothetical protein
MDSEALDAVGGAYRPAHVPGLKRDMLRNCAAALGNGILKS